MSKRILSIPNKHTLGEPTMPLGRAQFISPVTGRLTLYNEHKFLRAIEPVEAIDTNLLVEETNTELYNQSVDAFTTQARHIQTGILDYVEVTGWVPTEPIPEGAASLFAIMATITAIVTAKLFALIVGALVFVSVAWVIQGLYMQTAYPKLYYTVADPLTGEIRGPWARESVVTWNQSNYPDYWVDPTTTMVVDPSQPDAQEKINFIIENTPSGWGEPSGGWTDQIIMLLVVGGLVIGSIIALPYLLRTFKRKGD